MIPDDLPRDLPTFIARFGTDEQCRDYLFKARWPEGTVNLSAEDRKEWGCCWSYAAAVTSVILAQDAKALVRAARYWVAVR